MQKDEGSRVVEGSEVSVVEEENLGDQVLEEAVEMDKNKAKPKKVEPDSERIESRKRAHEAKVAKFLAGGEF